MVEIEKTAFGEEKGSCADACCQVCVLILLNNPVK